MRKIMYRFCFAALCVLLTSGCAIKQKVNFADALSVNKNRQVCVINNASVREGFLES